MAWRRGDIVVPTPRSLSGSSPRRLIGGDDDDSASSDNVIETNMITCVATYNVYSNWEGPVGSGNIVRSNGLWGDIDEEGGMTVSDNLHAGPRFVDRANRNYRLAEGSPCLSVLGREATPTGAKRPGLRRRLTRASAGCIAVPSETTAGPTCEASRSIVRQKLLVRQ